MRNLPRAYGRDIPSDILEMAAILPVLERRGFYDAARQVNEEMSRRMEHLADAVLARKREEHSPISPRWISDMDRFGCRLGKMIWVPAALNRREYDLSWVRRARSMKDAAWTTRRTRRFAQALLETDDPSDMIRAGWSGYLVEIEIASADAAYDFEPHWGSYARLAVYVSEPAQALRLMPVMRDRAIREETDDEVPLNHLWTFHLGKRQG